MQRPTTAPAQSTAPRKPRKPEESQVDLNRRVFQHHCDVEEVKVLKKKHYEESEEAWRRIADENLRLGYSKLNHARRKKDRLRKSPSPAKARRTPQNEVVTAANLPPGIENQGATCYISAMLQGLKRIQVFETALSTWKNESQTPEDGNDCIALQLKLLFQKMKRWAVSPLCTKALTDAYSKQGHWFEPGTHGDMMGFFGHIMEYVFEKHVTERSNFEITEVYAGRESEIYISLPVEKNLMTVEDILRDAMKTRNFQKFGNVLVIELVLQQGESGLVKSDFQVDVPLKLDLKKHLRGSSSYRLVAATYHIGRSFTRGHYFALAEDLGEWYKLDDCNVDHMGKFSGRLPRCVQGDDTTPNALFYVKQPRVFEAWAADTIELESIRSGSEDASDMAKGSDCPRFCRRPEKIWDGDIWTRCVVPPQLPCYPGGRNPIRVFPTPGVAPGRIRPAPRLSPRLSRQTLSNTTLPPLKDPGGPSRRYAAVQQILPAKVAQEKENSREGKTSKRKRRTKGNLLLLSSTSQSTINLPIVNRRQPRPEAITEGKPTHSSTPQNGSSSNILTERVDAMVTNIPRFAEVPVSTNANGNGMERDP